MPRRDVGIFDRTHLRWFMLRDAWELCAQAGLEVQEVSRQMRLTPRGSRSDTHGGASPASGGSARSSRSST